MNAAILHSLNSKWEIREVETLKPSANQVLIKINASGLCYTNVHITKGDLPLPLNFPLILGHEPAGEIVEVGESITTRKKGDRVGVPWVQKTCGRCEWCQRGKRLFCEKQQGTGVTLHGAMQSICYLIQMLQYYYQMKFRMNKLHLYFVLAILYIMD